MLSANVSLSLSNFDWQQLHQLAGGDVAFEAELLSLFIEDVEQSLAQLEQAIVARNVAAIEDIAHGLRGASANVGATAIARTAYRLEQAARAGRIESDRTIIATLHSHCQAITAYLQSKASA